MDMRAERSGKKEVVDGWICRMDKVSKAGKPRTDKLTKIP